MPVVSGRGCRERILSSCWVVDISQLENRLPGNDFKGDKVMSALTLRSADEKYQRLKDMAHITITVGTLYIPRLIHV